VATETRSRYDARARAQSIARFAVSHNEVHMANVSRRCERDSPARFASWNATIIARVFFLCACVLQASRRSGCCDKLALAARELIEREGGRGERGEVRGESTGAVQCAVNWQNDGSLEDSSEMRNRSNRTSASKRLPSPSSLISQ